MHCATAGAASRKTVLRKRATRPHQSILFCPECQNPIVCTICLEKTLKRNTTKEVILPNKPYTTILQNPSPDKRNSDSIKQTARLAYHRMQPNAFAIVYASFSLNLSPPRHAGPGLVRYSPFESFTGLPRFTWTQLPWNDSLACHKPGRGIDISKVINCARSPSPLSQPHP